MSPDLALCCFINLVHEKYQRCYKEAPLLRSPDPTPCAGSIMSPSESPVLSARWAVAPFMQCVSNTCFCICSSRRMPPSITPSCVKSCSLTWFLNCVRCWGGSFCGLGSSLRYVCQKESRRLTAQVLYDWCYWDGFSGQTVGWRMLLVPVRQPTYLPIQYYLLHLLLAWTVGSRGQPISPMDCRFRNLVNCLFMFSAVFTPVLFPSEMERNLSLYFFYLVGGGTFS